MRTSFFPLILSSSSMAGTATINSNPILIDQIYGFAIQAIWTGTPNGTLKLQASCDPISRNANVSVGDPYPVTNWTDISNTSVSVSGSAGNTIWNLDAQYYTFIRLTYTNSSSTGVLSAQIVEKGA